MKTIISVVAVAATLAAPVFAAPDISRAFAECTGRFSAEMEHSWLIYEPEDTTAEIIAERATFISLLEAVTTPEEAPGLLNHRIAAKMAHAVLLQQAQFSLVEDRAEWAGARAAASLQLCRSLLLGG